MSERVKEKRVSERQIHNMKEKKYVPNFFRKEHNKKETLAQVVSCKFCETFKNTFFYRTRPVAAFVSCRCSEEE